jgi:hypothetical protein
MLLIEEKQIVVDAVTAWTAAQGSPRAVLATSIADIRFQAALPEGVPPLTLAQKTVELCVQDAWNSTPSWLEQLFNGLSLRLIPAIDALWREVSQRKPPPGPDPLAAAILNGSTPFINRTNLRKRLATLASDAAKARPILVIDGATRSGKSYSTRYIDHFANTKTGITPYLYPPFDSEQANATGPEEMATDLVRMMGRPLKDRPPLNTNKDRYGLELAQWVCNEATQQGGQHWFVLDNFRGETLRPDTRKFLTTLTSLIVTGRYPSSCRLILIGIDQTLLGVDAGKVETERVTPHTDADIDAAIAEIHQRLPSLTAATLRAFVADGLPPAPAKMPELGRRLNLLLLAVNEIATLLTNVPTDSTQPGYIDREAIVFQMLANLPPDGAAIQELKNRLNDLADSLVP